MRARLLRGVGANAYAQGVTVVGQLCTVPVFLHAWGQGGFGLWLTLSAWASLLSLADAGLMAAGGNAMAMAAGRGDRAAAARLFAGLLRVVLWLAGVLGLAVVAGALGIAALTGGAAPDACRTFAALAIAALAGLPAGTLDLALRANGDYAAGAVATSTIRLAESLAAVACAVAGQGIAAAALAILGCRLLGIVALRALLLRRVAWAKDGSSTGAWRDIRPLAPSALAALAIPLGLGLSLQGTTIAAGSVLPAALVASFVAARTLTRALVQALGLFTHALMPEASFAAGRGDLHRSAALARLNLSVGLALLVPGWVLLVTFGPDLMAWWTGGSLRPDPLFFGTMATTALVHGAWMSASNLLLAANRQAAYAYPFGGVAAATCLLAALLGGGFGMRGLALAGLVGECGMAALVLPGQVQSAFRYSPPRVRP